MLEIFILLLKLCQEIYICLQEKLVQADYLSFRKLKGHCSWEDGKYQNKGCIQRLCVLATQFKRERLDILIQLSLRITLKITTSNTLDYCFACFTDTLQITTWFTEKGRPVAMATINQRGEDKENAKKRTSLVTKYSRVLRVMHL